MDDVIESVGSFGKFQFKLLTCVGLVSALSSCVIYATIFSAAEPNLICKRINLNNNNNYSYLNLSFSNTDIINKNASSYDNHHINKTQMPNLDDELDNCKVWSNLVYNSSKYERYDVTKRSNEYECYFDKSYYDLTIINEWNLICNRHYRASLTQTIHISGSILGFFGGIFGDRHGRKNSLILFAFLLTFTLTTSQFLITNNFIEINIETKYIIYSISQFLVGFLVDCVYCTAYVLLLEFTTDKYRTIIANLNSYFYIFGELLVLIVFYFSRSWHVLNWFIALYALCLFLFICYFLPESPAWLISYNRYDEAYVVLKRVAKSNGKKNYKPPMSFIEDMNAEKKLLDESSNKISNENSSSLNGDYKTDLPEESKNYKFDIFVLKDLFIPKSNLIKTSVLFYIWAAIMLLYYGISLGVTSVDLVNPYLMYLLSSIAEIIGYSFCYLNDYFGRKKTMSAFFFITTLMYPLIAILSEYGGSIEQEHGFSTRAVFIMIFGLLGKCAISELYPTTTRNTAVLFLTCFAGMSSLISPQINMLKSVVWKGLPYMIYSVFGLIGCFSIWLLPETKKDLTESDI